MFTPGPSSQEILQNLIKYFKNLYQETAYAHAHFHHFLWTGIDTENLAFDQELPGYVDKKAETVKVEMQEILP